MNETKKREPRLILAETDELAAVYEDDEEGSVAIIGLGTGDYVASMAKACAAARDKREG